MTSIDRVKFGIAQALLAVLLLGSCGGTSPLVTDHLDPLTGVTVTSATKPLVFYRDQSARAAYAKDFVYLGPIEINKMGSRSYYIWLGVWGSSDSTDRSSQMDDFESVVVYADGEPLGLEISGWTPQSIGLSESVYVKPVASATDGYYRVTIDQIRLMAEANDIEIRAGTMMPRHYIQWDTTASGNDAIVRFVHDVY